MKNEGVTKVITVHPVRDMNVSQTSWKSTKEPCGNIQLKTQKVNMVVALETKSGIIKVI